jgi:hypothetical protein
MVEIEKALHYLKTVASDYAKHKAQCEYLKEFRKSKKAMLINEAEKNGLKTAQERESYAYSHNEYLTLLDGLKVAIEESERLRIMVKTAELQIEVWRSQNSRATAEMKLR